MLKFAPYSYSKISTYKSCPLKFKYQYIDRIGKFESTPALVKGRTVHYLIENTGLAEENYSDEMKQNIKDYPGVLDIIKNFKESELGIKYLKDIDKEPIQEFKLGLSKELKASEYTKDSLFNGIVDYICVKSGTLYICDLKTGKYRDNQYQDYNQLLFYAIYFFEKYKIEKIVISFIYVEHNLENDLELNIKYLNNYKKELLLNIKTIEEDSEFCAKKSKLCDYCGFHELCYPELLS